MIAYEWGHPTYAQYAKLSTEQRVKSPCCGRRVRAGHLMDMRMMQAKDRPQVYGKSLFCCEHCLNHWVLNLQKATYGQMARLMQAPQKHIDGADKLDVHISLNRPPRLTG